MTASVYSLKDLKKMHRENARMVRAKLGRGAKVTIDEHFLRVSENGTQLVTPYRYTTKDAPGHMRADTFATLL